ncbi:MAG: potassium transporter TrkG [Desulfurococcaceae archaeon]
MMLLSIIQSISPIIMMFGLLMLTVPIIDALYMVSINKWFLILGLVYVLIGFVSTRLFIARKKEVELTFLEALISYSMVWLIIPILAAIPLCLDLSIPFVDAFFESISGFTGTGLTILRNLDNTSPGILLWRGLMQWTGELGVVVFTAVFLPFFWRFGYILYSIERPSRISASLRETARMIFYLYFLITAVGIILCIYLGVEPLDAVVHVMTAIATGGMSNYDVNYQRVFEYAPLSIYPITILMIIGGFNFITLSYILNGEIRRSWEVEEFRVYLFLNILFTVVSLVVIMPIVNWSIEDGFKYGSFNVISAFTTTGFSIGNIGELGPVMKLLLILAMFVGCMSFSTGGGIKVVRLIVLMKKFKSYILRYLTGGGVEVDIKLGNTILDEREVSNVMFFIVLHFLFILIGAGLLKAFIPEIDFIDTLFEATSAASNVGLTVGITSSSIPNHAKMVLMILMYFGRLEYTGFIVLVGLTLYREYRIILS